MASLSYRVIFLDGTSIVIPGESRVSQRLLQAGRKGFFRVTELEKVVDGGLEIVHYNGDLISRIITLRKEEKSENVPNVVPSPFAHAPIVPEKTPEEVAEAADALKAVIRGRRKEFEAAKKRGPGRPPKVVAEEEEEEDDLPEIEEVVRVGE